MAAPLPLLAFSQNGGLTWRPENSTNPIRHLDRQPSTTPGMVSTNPRIRDPHTQRARNLQPLLKHDPALEVRRPRQSQTRRDNAYARGDAAALGCDFGHIARSHRGPVQDNFAPIADNAPNPLATRQVRGTALTRIDR